MDIIIATLLMTHLTIVCVTLYLHRGQAHRSLIFNPILEHTVRLWLWLSTGMVTKQWVAVHRKHHRFTEAAGDPHSPHVYGINRVMWQGALLYHEASKDRAMVASYGAGTPNDWLENNLYSKHSRLGIAIMLLIDLYFFGAWGFLVWAIQMLWIPFWAAGVVNGLGHWFGYRNTDTKDKSTNLSPWGIIIGGEELHNNHHKNPASAKLSEKWWEVDIGWLYVRILSFFKMIQVRQTV